MTEPRQGQTDKQQQHNIRIEHTHREFQDTFQQCKKIDYDAIERLKTIMKRCKSSKREKKRLTIR